MPHHDIGELLAQTNPVRDLPTGLDVAMAETARSIAHGPARSPRRRAVRPAAWLGAVAAVALLIGGTVATQRDSQHLTVSRAADDAADRLRLVAAQAAPDGLPLPDGVTLDDARSFVADLLVADPRLQRRGPFVLVDGELVTDLAGQTSDIPRNLQESGVTAAYVYYVRCQWERTMLGKPLGSLFLVNGKRVDGTRGLRDATEGDTITLSPDDPGVVALIALGDPSAWGSDGYEPPVRRDGAQGGAALPADADGLREDFEQNCTNGFGDAPAGE